MKRVRSSLLLGMLAVFSSGAQSPAGTEQELLQLEHAWTQAIVKRDAKFLRQLYADEYRFTSTEGAVLTKPVEIFESTSSRVILDSFKLEDMQVRLYGDVAIVTGLNVLKGRYFLENVGGSHRFTDVFVKRDGRWQVVASHASLASRFCHATTSIVDMNGGKADSSSRYVPC